MRSIRTGLVMVAALLLGGCGYNTLQTQDESTKAAWSEVLNQYQRRADLIPNLVNTVKGYAAQEERVLVGVTEARARATSIQLTPEMLNDPEAVKKFNAAQGDLSAAADRSPCAALNFLTASGSLSISGVSWMEVARARASVTPTSTRSSCAAYPFTVFTRFGMRSARRWYWFSTSDHAALVDSSWVCRVL